VQLVAGLDVGGSSVKAWVAEVGGDVVAQDVRALPSLRPAPDRVEMDPDTWEAACRAALTSAAAAAPVGDWLGVTVSTLRQGFVLLGSDGARSATAC
jgi:sugar (pentulose or hexulose) kinase